MAGSYIHVTEEDGSLGDYKYVGDMLSNGGDVFEAVEEMYGMIWYLAKMVEAESDGDANRVSNVAVWVDEARNFYKEGLRISPTERYN